MKEANRKIKENDMMEFFEKAPNMSTYELQEAVFKMINESRQPNYEILRAIPVMSRYRLMKAASDFYLKGSGLGVKN